MPPYFINTYCVMIFVTINPEKSPLSSIRWGRTMMILLDIYCECSGLWLVVKMEFCGVDNTILHSDGNVDQLAEFLWDAPGLDEDP